ncbi:MAG: hypothetical protein K0S18_1360 [Anaerocolumna sp.]|jgi:DNA-binding protein Fis|nr:hypothetical protein [Anaerocolumna sp.]
MSKSKFCSIAIAGMLTLVGIGPETSFAAQANTETETISEVNSIPQEKKAAMKEKLKQAKEKWGNLTANQKEEIYSLIEDRMQVEDKIMDKLVEYGVLEKEDAESNQAHIQEKYNKMKESGQFPFFKR